MPFDRLSRWFNAPERRADADLPSAARAAAGTGPDFEVADATAVIGRLMVSAVSGLGPTLDVRLETTADDGASWYTVGAFPQQTGATTARVARVFGPVGQRCRWAWALTGSSVTFDVITEVGRDD